MATVKLPTQVFELRWKAPFYTLEECILNLISGGFDRADILESVDNVLDDIAKRAGESDA